MHANLDLDNVLVYLTPFGGDHFKLINFDNARMAGSSVHPIFQNIKAKKQPFVSPEIADTDSDARSKPMLSSAADIWSLGVLTFILRTNCLPMNREALGSAELSRKTVFDPEAIINSY